MGNLRMFVYSGLIVALVSVLSVESFAKKKSKSSSKEKVTVAKVKSKAKVKKDMDTSASDQIKVIRRKPASVEIPEGVPTELPEKMFTFSPEPEIK